MGAGHHEVLARVKLKICAIAVILLLHTLHFLKLLYPPRTAEEYWQEPMVTIAHCTEAQMALTEAQPALELPSAEVCFSSVLVS